MFQIFTPISLLKNKKKNASRTLNNEIILIKNLFLYKKIKNEKSSSLHISTNHLAVLAHSTDKTYLICSTI